MKKIREVIAHDKNSKLPTTCQIESKLDEADIAAAVSAFRYTEDEVFSRARERIRNEKV